MHHYNMIQTSPYLADFSSYCSLSQQSMVLKHAAILSTMRPQFQGRLVLSQTFADAIPSAGRVLSPRICKAVPPIFLQGSAQVPL